MKRAVSAFDEKEILGKVQTSARTIISMLLDLEYVEPEKDGLLRGIRINALGIQKYVEELST